MLLKRRPSALACTLTKLWCKSSKLHISTNGILPPRRAKVLIWRSRRPHISSKSVSEMAKLLFKMRVNQRLMILGSIKEVLPASTRPTTLRCRQWKSGSDAVAALVTVNCSERPLLRHKRANSTLSMVATLARLRMSQSWEVLGQTGRRLPLLTAILARW